MRKFLRKFFWSHGTLLGYLGSLSQKGRPEIFSKWVLINLSNPLRHPAPLVDPLHTKNLDTAGPWCGMIHRHEHDKSSLLLSPRNMCCLKWGFGDYLLDCWNVVWYVCMSEMGYIGSPVKWQPHRREWSWLWKEVREIATTKTNSKTGKKRREKSLSICRHFLYKAWRCH